MDEKKPHPCPDGDVLKVGPELPGGARPFIRHKKDHEIQTGIITPVREGEALNGRNVFHLESRTQDDDFDVTEIATAPTPQGTGPAMVNSEEFKTGWDRIFGSKPAVGEA